MKERTTITQMARRLNVHHTTISLALRDSKEVSQEMKQRVKALAKEMRYMPNHFARSMRLQSSRTIGVVFPWASLPPYSTLLDYLYAEAKARNYQLDVRFTSWAVEQESLAIDSLLERFVDGCIITSSEGLPLKLLRSKFSAQKSIPVVIFGTPVTVTAPFRMPAFIHRVGTDLERGSEILGKHLADLGHRRIALISTENPLAENGSANSRFKGLKKALEGIPKAELLPIWLNDTEMGPVLREKVEEFGMDSEIFFSMCEHLANRVLNISPLPTAIVASSEPMAHVLLTFLNKKGVRVPEDMSVACYDGTFLSAYGGVPITCVQQPMRQMAQKAIELVVAEKPAQKAMQNIHVMESTLIERDSVAPPKASSIRDGKKRTLYKTKEALPTPTFPD